MHATAGLNDPPISNWETVFQDRDSLHAVVLVADATDAGRTVRLNEVNDVLRPLTSVVVTGTQEGKHLRNAQGEGLEHFGYVDGRSQPLFLTQDVEEERLKGDGIHHWDPAFPLAQVIVPDAAAPDPAIHFGSYFIVRKLEQDVRKFKTLEKVLAMDLDLADEERAGAMIVGRFEDGAPATLQSAEGAHSPVMNDFTYAGDAEASKCPFAGHIRKTNPRGSGGFGQTPAQERSHLMARRGQTYGERDDDPNDGRLDNKPRKDVGLLFMAFNSDIAHQFEFTQAAWANQSGFPQVPSGSPTPGIDLIIGQTPGGAARPHLTCPATWGDPTSMKTVLATPQTVTMKGGAYFFMPSLAFLASL